MLILLYLVLLVADINFLPVSSSSLTCLPSSPTCPGSVISCQCLESINVLNWVVTSPAGVELLNEEYVATDTVGVVTSQNSYTLVLCDVDRGNMRTVFSSTLNLTFTEGISVICRDNSGSETATLERAIPPSAPVNMSYIMKSTAADSVNVRLDWDPPLDDGGVTVTSYQIFVYEHELVVTTDTVAYTLNCTGEHLVEVRAVNCAGISPTTSVLINTTGICLILNTEVKGFTEFEVATTEIEVSTVNYNLKGAFCNTSSDALLILNTAAVVGTSSIAFVVGVLLYTCGVLTGLLVQRKKRSKSTSTPDSSKLAPIYEEVNTTLTPTSISLNENVSYGQFKA